MLDTKLNTEKLLHFVATKFEANEIDNNCLVQLIELAAAYLNLQTLPQWAANHNTSYNGAKLQTNKIEILGIKFIIDNE